MTFRIFWAIAVLVFTAVPAFAQLTGQAASGKVSRLLFLREESFAANGVDTGTGAFTMEVPVMQVEGGRQLSFQLRYNSLLNFTGGEISPGWTHNFETRLTPASPFPTGGGPLRVNIDNGRILTFPEGGGSFQGGEEASRYDRMETQSPSGWRLTRRDGTRYLFDANGRMTREENKVRQRLQFEYTNGRLSEVYEPIANRRIRLHYQSPGGPLESIIDDANRISFLEYDSARRLRSIHPPAKLSESPALPGVNRTIPDNNTNGVTVSVPVSGRGRVGIVRLSSGTISHSRPADLRVSIVSPSGRTVELRFPNSQGPVIQLGGRAFGQFWADDANGEWRIVVRDVVSGTTGSLSPTYLQFTDRTTPTDFLYDSSGRLVNAFDSTGSRLFTNVYDAEGRLVEQDDAVDGNFTATFAYAESPTGVLTVYRDRLGNEWEYRHDAGHHLTSLTNPLNAITRFSYDSNGNRISVTDALLRVTRFTYDSNGNVSAVTDPLNSQWTFSHDNSGNVQSISDPLANQTSFTYDNNNNLRAVRDALGNRDTKTYNANSQLTGSLMEDGAGINFTYSGGKPVGVGHPATGANQGASYDEIGLPSVLKDADGFETKLEYDDQGREIRKTNPLGDSEEFEYDVRGRLVRYRDFNGNQTTYTYDGNDNLIEIRDAQGNRVRYRYDGEDRLIGTIAPNGAESRLVYDKAGRVVEEQDPLGNKRRYVYDAAGNRTAEYDAQDRLISSATFTNLDLPAVQRDADGNAVGLTYDALGRPVRIVNPAGAEIRTTYDAINRPVKMRDPLGREPERTYAPDDVVRTLVDSKGVTALTFSYDQANRLVSVETRSGFQRFRYNNRDLVDRYTAPGGEVLSYTYDGAGRVTAITPSGTNSGSAPTIRYTYDKNGNVLTVQQQGGGAGTVTIRRTFDALDRVTRYTDARGNSIQYSYDANGNLATLRYPDGKVVAYSYDTANRLQEIRDWAGRRTRYQYDADSRITRIDFPNGTSRVMSYDTRGRVIRRQDRNAIGLKILDFRYSYGSTGLLAVENALSMQPGYIPNAASFTYNNQNQIETYNGEPATYDRNARMTRGPLGAGSASFNYDFRGNLVGGGDTSFVYDAEDRLTRIVGNASQDELIVNPVGDFSQVLMRQGSGGSSDRTFYVWGVGLAYEVNGNDQIRVYHYDQRGSVVAFTNTSGAVDGRVAYGPYGEVIARSGNTNSLYLFQGLFGVLTAPNGLNLMGIRWYSPAAKRFLTEDPYFGTIERPASLNRYAYAGADPINRNDPNGKFIHFLAAAVGAVVNVAVQAVSDVIAGEFSGWEAYAGAAIGGAVAGLVISTTGCIACAGAAGSATEYLVTRGLKGEPINFVELAVVAGVGAVTAKVGDKAGKVLGATGRRAGKAMGKALGKNAARPVAQRFSRRALKKALQREATKQKYREVLEAIPEEFGTGLAEELVTRPVAIQAILNPQSAPQGTTRPPTIIDATEEGAQALNRGRNQNYGEFFHWKFYLEALQLAAVPVPNNPNNLLTSF